MLKKAAIFSTHDKEGIEHLARVVVENLGWEIMATPGTKSYLEAHGLEVSPLWIVEHPEEFDGLARVIDKKVVLAFGFDRENPKHIAKAEELNIPQIDLLVCNLRPLPRHNVSIEEKKPDLNGIFLLNEAILNPQNHITVVTDKEQYGSLVNSIERFGKILQYQSLQFANQARMMVGEYSDQIYNNSSVAMPREAVNEFLSAQQR